MDDIAQEAVRESLAGLDVETPPTHREFSSTITLPAGPLKGKKYNPNSDRCQSYLIDQLDAGQWERIAVCGPPQLAGKTQCAILLPALRAAIACKLPVGYGLPTLNDLDKAWAEKLKPSIEGGGYGDRLPKMGPGARGGRAPVLTFQDPETGLPLGRLVFLAGGAYGSTVAVVVVDEVDQLRKSDGEPLWEDLEDMFHRADSFREKAIRIAVGTVEHDEKSIILTLVYEQGTGTRPWLQCPHCNQHQLVSFDQLTYDKTDEIAAAQTAAVVCRLCGAHWSESDRQKAIRNALFVHKGQSVVDGAVVGDVPRTKTLGLLWTALESSLSSVAEIAVEHLRAETAARTANYALMRKFVRYRQCERYHEPTAPTEITNRSLSENNSARSTYDKRTVPPWVSFLTMACDVQGDRHYWMVAGHGPDDRWAIIDWGYEMLVPKDLERKPTPSDRIRVMDQLRDLADAGWQVAGTDRKMRPVSCGIDVGYLPEQVVAWVQGNPKWKAVRGVGQDEIKDRPGSVEKALPPEVRQTGLLQVRRPPGWSVYWHRIDGSRFRRSAHAALLRDPDQPASGMVPRGLPANDNLLLHLSAVVWVEPTTNKDGRPIDGYWREKVHPRWDLQDCLLYNLGLGLLHRYAPEMRDNAPAPRDSREPRGDEFGGAVW